MQDGTYLPILLFADNYWLIARSALDLQRMTIDRVQPRAEIRDQQSVFIGTALLENQDGRLRPGMEGKARVLCPKRPVGWLLFHKPWEALRMWSGW